MSVDYRPDYDPADVNSDYGHTGGDITVPTFTGDTRPFRFWCQKALPLVYDDSLSYYEVLCKMADYMNNFVTDLTTVEDSMTEFGQQFVINQQFLNSMADQLGQNVADLEAYINARMDDFMAAYTQLQTYVNNYFDNLDVQQEINTKLDEMASDGTLNDLFDPVLETWMQQKTAQIDAAIANQDAMQAQQNSRISVLEGRMDTFEGLPSGSTAGNAELVGIRTNFLGEVYPTAGDAVRASDMIASGFVSIPVTRLEEWNENEASSTYDTIQFDVSAYKGGRVIMIANMDDFVSTAESVGVGVFASNVSGKTVDQNGRAYAFTSNVFPSYSVIPTQIQGEERIALHFSIPEDFSYQYLKMGFVQEIPNGDYTQPAAIVYANSWSKTQVDPTLTIAGAAADAKAAGDAIDELNERLEQDSKTFYDFADEVLDNYVIANDYIYGRYLSAGFADVTTYARNRTPYPAGKYEIGPYASNGFIAFEYISDTQGNAIFNNYVTAKQTITATKPFYITFNNITGSEQLESINSNFVVRRISEESTLESDVKTLQNSVENIEELVDDIIIVDEPINIFDGVFVTGEQVATSSGAFVPGTGYARTNYIPIKAGVVNIGVQALRAPSTVFLHCALYDNNHTKLSAFPYTGITVNSASDLHYQTVTATQDGYIAWDISSANVGNYNYYVSQETTPTGYKPYFEPKEYINPELLPELEVSEIITSMTYGKTPSQAKKATFTDGETLVVESNSVMKNQCICFTAKVGNTFNGVEVGHGTGSYGYYIRVDGTNMSYCSNGSIGTSIPHGLTIQDFIGVMITVDVKLNITVIITTSGGIFKRTQQIDSSWRGDVFAKNINSSLTDAVLTWNSDDYKCPLWAFGDSYFTIYSPTRWPYYIANQWGFDNVLFNAYPGEASATAYQDLTNALTHGTPKYIFWCMGMNDPDANSAPNATWLEKVEALLDVCEEKGITPILATIPNVTHASYNNQYKNNWIRNSGVRYVDFASAVENVTGWLSNDGVHPSEIGGRLLALTVLSNVPEITQGK